MFDQVAVDAGLEHLEGQRRALDAVGCQRHADQIEHILRFQLLRVIDGFAGNIMLKTSEAVAKLIVDKIKEAIKTGGPLAMLGGILVKPALGKIKKLLDPSEEGAAPLLGVNGLVFIGHGRSDEIAIKNAIRVAKNAAEAKVVEAMKAGIQERFKR